MNNNVLTNLLTATCDIPHESAAALVPGLRVLIEQEAEYLHRAEGSVVVTKTAFGEIIAVTRQDDEGRVLKTISQAQSNNDKLRALLTRCQQNIQNPELQREIAAALREAQTEPPTA